MTHSFPKIHQFEVWYTHFRPEKSILYSCSDDCSFKALDFRSNSLIYSCKKHDAGVTWLKAISENEVMTCSYDGTVRIWDERYIKSGALEQLNFPGKSLWDVNYYLCEETGKLWMGIAAIYDGYLFLRPDKTDLRNESLTEHFRALNKLEEGNGFSQYLGHGSICYAFEYIERGTESDVMLTSSFYDNTLQTIRYYK